MKISATTRRRLEQAARRAASASYSPYSRFPVGAAVIADSGKIYIGCNVENASYGLCNCAERTALFTAIASGERAIRGIAVYSSPASPVAPCGACRQVMNEFKPETGDIYVILDYFDDRTVVMLAELLPRSFGPRDLERAT